MLKRGNLLLLKTLQILPIICNNLETVLDRV